NHLHRAVPMGSGAEESPFSEGDLLARMIHENEVIRRVERNEGGGFPDVFLIAQERRNGMQRGTDCLASRGGREASRLRVGSVRAVVRWRRVPAQGRR